jgi:hypothetical protein
MLYRGAMIVLNETKGTYLPWTLLISKDFGGYEIGEISEISHISQMYKPVPNI